MQAYSSGNAAERYLIQRIQGASSEQLAAMLLEGAQRFLALAINAIKSRDIPGKARYVNRVSAIIEELTIWLNTDEGGDLVNNLQRLYEWWLNELFEGSQANQSDRLERISRQMGEIREAWEAYHVKKVGGGAEPRPAASLDGMLG